VAPSTLDGRRNPSNRDFGETQRAPLLAQTGPLVTSATRSRAPDGYTLLLVNPANAINATLYKKLNFDFIRDVAPVAGIFRAPLVMVVNGAFPAKTVPEFIAYAKANRGKINMASAGIGATSHVAGEMFKAMPASIWFTYHIVEKCP